MQLDRSALSLGQDLSRSLGDERAELVREWVAEHCVRDEALTSEEGVRSDTLGSVDDLVGDHKVARGDFLSQRSDGREGNNGLDTDVLQRGDVGSGRNLSRGDGVREAVSGDKGDERARGELRDGHRGRGLSPWLLSRKAHDLSYITHRVNVDSLTGISDVPVTDTYDSHRGQVVEVVEASAANDTDEDWTLNERF